MKNYDLIIIGGGGGLKLRPASDLGKKVAVIEKEDLGGTCLNRGCIPSKMLIHAAEVADEIKNAHRYEIDVDTNFNVNFEDLVTRVTNFVSSSSEGIASSYEKNPNVDYYHAEAKFLEDKVLEVNSEKLSADRILIATGSRPRIPNIKGLKDTPFFTSREALRNTIQPKRMIVVGGSFTALELGNFYGALGTEVEFLVRSRILKHEDSDIAAEFLREFKEKYKMHFRVSPTEVKHDGENFTVTVEDKDGNSSQLKADSLLVATGIIPNSDNLGLENTSIEVDERGFIKVDDHLQTTVKGIYCIGDVNGNYLFRHSVNFEGEYLLRTLYANPSDEPIKYSPMPHAVFSSPQIGAVGKTEDQLKKEGADYVVGLNKYENSAMGDALRSEYGLVKILIDKRNHKLLGAHIVGKEASNMIHTLIAYINMDATLEDMLRTIYIHPALPENIRNAARNAKKALEE